MLIAPLAAPIEGRVPIATGAAPTPAPGLQVGELREIHFGLPRAWEPVLLGVRVGPDAGWASRADAEAGVAALRGSDHGSAVAIMRDDERYVAHFLTTADGHDVRPWHVPVEFRAADARWEATVMGPSMPQPA